MPQIGAFTQLLEIVLYIIIYKDIFNHDKYMFNASIITKDNYNKRKKKNSFTLTAQVLCFVGEALFTFSLVFLNATSTNPSSKEFTVIFRVQQFAFLMLIKAGCTQEVRQSLVPKFVERFVRFLLNVLGDFYFYVYNWVK